MIYLLDTIQAPKLFFIELGLFLAISIDRERERQREKEKEGVVHIGLIFSNNNPQGFGIDKWFLSQIKKIQSI